MKNFLWLAALLITFSGVSQNLKPGFDKKEYLQLLHAFSRWGDSSVYKKIPESRIYKKKNRRYRSEEIGLLNCWEMYETKTHSVMSIRGSVDEQMSWMANFYAAMIPAKGKLQLNDTISFDYHFADNPKAAVHVGWSISSAYLLIDMMPIIKKQYQKGVRDFIIFGHSQGAAVSYYITAQLKYYQKTGELPADIQFKTYCSAAPKPGNLYFAYDYEASTQYGWSISVVNSVDWVPELPISIQTINDFNTTNPFKNVKKFIKDQPFPRNLAMKYAHYKLTKHTRKALKQYQFFLGTIASKMVEQKLEGFKDPEYYNSNNYVRCGNMIVMQPKQEYFALFPDSDDKLFMHHGVLPYIYLAEKL